MAQLADPAPPEDTIAFLSSGRLFVKRGTAPAEEIPCTFAEELRERSERLRQDSPWDFSGLNEAADAIVLGQDTEPVSADDTTVVAIAPSCQSGEVFYGLTTADLAGIVRRPIEPIEAEQRLVHTNGSRLASISAPDADGQIVCGFGDPSGRQNLSVYRLGSPGFAEITEGDSIDSAACWIPGKAGQLVYQSAGIARDSSGRFAGTAPASIELLDAPRGELHSLLAATEYDFLAPQATGDSKLYCIRRPSRRSLKQCLQVAARRLLTLPLDCARSIFKPSPAPDRDAKLLTLLDNPTDATDTSSDAIHQGELRPDIVPKSWQLVRTEIESPSATSAEVIVSGAIAYHVMNDGRILYSNGSAIFSIPPSGGKPELVEEIDGAQQIVALRSG